MSASSPDAARAASEQRDRLPRPAAGAALQDGPALVDYAKSLDCIHCGLCLQTCPTFRLTGAEAASPRGRIHLMRAVGEGRLTADEAFADEMDFCLLCRHCESVCPAGVRFGEMMEYTRGALAERGGQGLFARGLRALGFRILLPSRTLLRLAGSLLRLGRLTGLERLAPLLFGERGAAARHLPDVPPLSARRLLPARTPARGAERGRALFLEGCVMPEFFAHVNRATVDSLAGLGVTSEVLPNVVCCGSLHAHNGDLEGARRLARRMIAAGEGAEDASGAPLPIVVNSAGCGAHMKECHHLFEPGDAWHPRARAFAARVRDYTELVAARLDDPQAPPLAAPAIPGPVTWDDPCHLCHAQGIRAEPRRILSRIAGLPTVELPDAESCCGSAGIYSLLRPAASAAVFERKLAALRASGARTVVTANPGCQLQWSSGLARAGEGARVFHLAELVAASLPRTADAPTRG